MAKIKQIDDIIAVQWIVHVALYIKNTEKLGLPDDIEENREQLKKMLTQHIESMLADVPINEDTNRKEMKLNKSLYLTWNRHGIISIEYSKEPYIYGMQLFGSPIECEECEVTSPETSEERIAVLAAENTTVYANRIADKLVERTSVFSPHSYQAASRYMQHFYTGKKTAMPHKLQTTIDNMKLFLKQIEALPSRYSRFDEFLSDFKAALIRPKDVETVAEAILDKMRETLTRYEDLDDEHLEHYKNNNDGTYDAVKSQSIEPFIKRAMEQSDFSYLYSPPQGCFDYESIIYSCANKYPELIRIEKDEKTYYRQYSARLPLSDMYREFIKLRSKYFAALHSYAFVDDFEMPFGEMWRKTWQAFEKGYYSPTDKNNYPRYISEDVVLRAPVMTMQTMERIDERIRTTPADEPVIGDNDSCSIIVKDIMDCGAPVCSAKDAYEDAVEAGMTQWLAFQDYAEILDFSMESIFEDTAVNRAGVKISIAALTDVYNHRKPDIAKIEDAVDKYIASIRTGKLISRKTPEGTKKIKCPSVIIPADPEYANITNIMTANVKKFIANLEAVQQALLSSDNKDYLKWLFAQRAFDKKAYSARLAELENTESEA